MDCNGCTECCTAFPVIELDKPRRTVCNMCDIGAACRDYENRPKSCRECLCVYAQMEDTPEDLRPDKCGIIFERASDKVFVGTVVHPVSRIGEGQIRAFLHQGFKVIINKKAL